MMIRWEKSTSFDTITGSRCLANSQTFASVGWVPISETETTGRIGENEPALEDSHRTGSPS